MTDSELYKKCCEYGRLAREARRRFAGLLPAVYERRLHKRRGFSSIHEFAAKLAGMSASSVDNILNLDRKLKDKPMLHNLLISGEQGWSKLRAVASVATPKTDIFWTEKIENMSKGALEKYVQNYRLEFFPGDEPDNIQRTKQERNFMSFKISPTIEKKLRLVKKRLEKEKGEELAFNDVFSHLLKDVKLKNENMPSEKELKKHVDEPAAGRHFPKVVEDAVFALYGYICAFPGCKMPYEILHHTVRFAISGKHNPKHIVPLCSEHEQLAHQGLIENEERHPTMWRIRKQPNFEHPKYQVDKMVQKFRNTQHFQ